MKPAYFIVCFLFYSFLLPAQYNDHQISNGLWNNWGVFLADMNSDGLTDIVTHTNYGIHWSRNLGNGEYTKTQPLMEFWDGFSGIKLIMDVDQDGDMDIILFRDYKLYLMRCNTAMLYSPEVIAVLPLGISNYALRMEINADGFPDFVIHQGDAVVVYKNENGTGFQSVFSKSIEPNSYYSAESYDLNHDGDEDLIFSRFPSGTKSYYESNGDGTFSYMYAVNSSPYESINFIGDLNNDGFTDIVYVSTENNGDTGAAPSVFQYKIHLGDATLNYQNDVDYSFYLPIGTYMLGFFCDWNDDGNMDFILKTDLSSNCDALYENSISYFLFDQNWQLNYSHRTECRQDVVPELLNMDNSGQKDFVYWSVNGEIGWISRSAGQSDVFHKLDQSYSSSRKVFLDDQDGNGFVDILVCNASSGLLARYWNDGNAMSEAELIKEFRMNYGKYLQKDMEGDGDLDVIGLYNEENDSCYVFINDQGTYNMMGIHTPESFQGENAVVADFNADGRMDLLYNIIDSNESYIRLSSDFGYFDLPPLDLGSSMIFRDAFDLDADGDADIIGGNGASLSAYSINQYPAELAFVPDPDYATQFGGGNYLRNIHWNDDGLEDLFFTTGAGSSRVAVNNGNGYDPVVFGPEGISNSTAYLDMNGDGITDYVKSLAYGNKVVMIHSGDEFVPAYTFQLEGDILGYGQFFESESHQALTYHHNQLFIEDLQIQPVISNLVGYTFIDYNADGHFNGDDHIFNMPVHVEAADVNYTFSTNGNFYYIGSSAMGEIAPVYDPAIWTLTTDSAVYHLLDNNNAYPIVFGFVPNGDHPGVNLALELNDFGCTNVDFLAMASITNSGNAIESGVLKMVFDQINFPIIAGGYSTAEDTVFFQVPDLLPGESFSFSLTLGYPGVAMMDSLFIATLSYVNDGFLASQSISEAILCSYDPNNIEVSPKGMGAQGFVLNETTLNYRINFQNMGSAPAALVSIKDFLNENLDVSTFQLRAASHTVSYILTEDGYLQFDFNDIQLPGASQDEPASHGFVEYSVDLKNDLPHGTIIQNSAEIYFDLNPPVITNIVKNTIMDCDVLKGFSISDSAVCPGEPVLFTSSGDYVMDYTWEWNGDIAGHASHASITSDVPGMNQIELITTNQICATSSSGEFMVFDRPAISVFENAGVMHAQCIDNVQWFFNGETMAGETSDSLLVNQNGDYYAMATNIHGCENKSAAIRHEIEAVNIFPNPALDHMTLQIIEEYADVKIFNAAGELVLNRRVNQTSFFDLSGFSTGIYEMMITQKSGNVKKVKLAVL